MPKDMNATGPEEKNAKISFLLPLELEESLNVLAKEKDRSVSSVVRVAVKEYIDKNTLPA